MKPTIGRIVLYKLTEADAARINLSRAPKAVMAFGGGETIVAGAHGNLARENDVYPAMIVRVFGAETDSCCNLQVFLDGNDAYWATSRKVGDAAGEFAWPSRA